MTDRDQPEEEHSGDEREVMARVTKSMADLLQRIAEFQEEMAPFLPLFAEPEEPAEGSTAATDERPAPETPNLDGRRRD